MKQIMVRYQVKPEQAAANEELVRAVFDELHRVEPTGFGYVTFQLEDGVTFVHLVSESEEDRPVSLADMPAFQKFLEGIGDRCDVAPVATGMREIASYRLFSDAKAASNPA